MALSINTGLGMLSLISRVLRAALVGAACFVVSSASAQVATAPVASSQPGVTLAVRSSGISWVSVKADGIPTWTGVMQPGDVKTWEARKSIIFTTANAGALQMALNGKPIPPIGGSGARVTRMFTAPPPSPEPSVEPPPEPAPLVTPGPSELPPPTPAPPPTSARGGISIKHYMPYLEIAILAILLVVSVLVLAAIYRERRLAEEANRADAGGEAELQVLAARKLARGLRLYLVGVGDRRFLLASGRLELLTEVKSAED